MTFLFLFPDTYCGTCFGGHLSYCTSSAIYVLSSEVEFLIFNCDILFFEQVVLRIYSTGFRDGRRAVSESAEPRSPAFASPAYDLPRFPRPFVSTLARARSGLRLSTSNERCGPSVSLGWVWLGLVWFGSV